MRMNTILAVCWMIAVGTSALAQVAVERASQRTPEQEARYQRHMARKAARLKQIADEGGLIRSHPTANVVRFVNAQKLVDDECIAAVARKISEVFSFPVEITSTSRSDATPLSVVFAGFAQPKTGVLVAIVESDDYPTLTICPENFYAIVNIKRLAIDGPTAELLTARIRKEIWRATMMAVGVGNAASQPDLMRPIRSLRDLDRYPTLESGPESLNVALDGAEAAGVEQVRRVTYQVACQEGWAPAPTNEVQQAIWDKVHAIPANPMKIEFDPKKGR